MDADQTNSLEQLLQKCEQLLLFPTSATEIVPKEEDALFLKLITSISRFKFSPKKKRKTLKQYYRLKFKNVLVCTFVIKKIN